MIIDERGVPVDAPDLSRGVLLDAEWKDFPAVERRGHYEYEALPGGGRRQTFVEDAPACPARREVTLQIYIRNDR